MSSANKPAFPNPGILETSPLCSMNGMTKRELFAAMAMQAMIAKYPVRFTNEKCDTESMSLAHGAVDYADSLLKALEQPQ